MFSFTAAEAEQSLNSVDGNVQSLGPNVTLITLNTEGWYTSCVLFLTVHHMSKGERDVAPW